LGLPEQGVKEDSMAKKVTATIHFMDQTKIVLEYPQQAGSDSATIAANVNKALKADKIVAEVSGDLLVIPTRNIKYTHLSPAPPKLPAGVLRNAWIE
jgi:hypothetical protein